MPHVIYLHSALTQQRIIPRSEKEARRMFRWSIPDVVIAMGLAGLVNMAMLYMAASTFFAHGQRNVADINTAYLTLTPLLGGAASLVFAISLLASGLSSSTVGTMARQVIMQGFVGFTARMRAVLAEWRRACAYRDGSEQKGEVIVHGSLSVYTGS